MNWIKRNLYFVIGAAVAVLLLGGAGYYTWSRYKLNAEKRAQINTLYDQLEQLHRMSPSPGNETIDNISTAQRQTEDIRSTLAKLARFFEAIPAVPPSTNVSSVEYAGALRDTIAQLQRDATNSGVVLPPDYAFSFEVQRRLMNFAAGSLRPLAVQLGEVKAIVSVLNEAKINSLDAVRRERVSADDSKGPITDYLGRVSETNDLAILSPYELEFKCFTPELSSLLVGFASSPYGLIVKSMNVEPAPTFAVGIDGYMPGSYMPTETYVPPGTYAPPTIYTPPAVTPATPLTPRPGIPEEQYGQRYGVGGGYNTTPRYPGRPGGGYGAATGYGPGDGSIIPPRYPVGPQPQIYAPIGAPTKPALQTVLDEKQLRVTMLVYVVKLLPKE